MNIYIEKGTEFHDEYGKLYTVLEVITYWDKSNTFKNNFKVKTIDNDIVVLTGKTILDAIRDDKIIKIVGEI